MTKELPGKNRKRSRWRKRWKIFKLCLILGFAYCSYSAYQIYRIGYSDSGEKADCAIVLGAAAWHKKPSPVFAARLDHAILLYQEGRVKKLLLTGGKGEGAPFAESEVALKYCLEAGIPPNAIFIETESLTTHENMKFAKGMMEQHALQSALLVSDPWHLRRALLMAESQGIEAQGSATKTSKYQSFRAKASFFCREFFYVQVYLVFGI